MDNNEEQRSKEDFIAESIASSNKNNYIGSIYLVNYSSYSIINLAGSASVVREDINYFNSIESALSKAHKKDDCIGIVPMCNAVNDFIYNNYKGKVTGQQSSPVEPLLPNGITWYHFNT